MGDETGITRTVAPTAGDDAQRLQVFQYLTAEKWRLYRSLMRLFVQAKAQFKLHLRPDQIAAELQQDSSSGLAADRLEIERALQQLVEWGNLEKHLDTVEVSSLQEFLRPRFLYQISEKGHAAERALQTYEAVLQEAGELQTTTLHEIRTELETLLAMAEQPDTDDGEASHRALEFIYFRFDQLTARAQTFMSSLQRTTQLQDVNLNVFLSYKQVLIDYLKRFISELTITSPQIANLLLRIESARVDQLLQAAARRELRDAALPPPPERQAAVLDQWRRRWRGLCGWFIAPPGERSQADELRSHATAAIPALLRAVAMVHDRRVTHSDRSADLRMLARWFAQADDDRQAHQLWRAAFSLTPARHLQVDEATLDLWDQQPVRASTSWFTAPPLRIAPRLRQTGRATRRGPSTQVVDHSQSKAVLAQLAARQAQQLAAARRVLATGRATRLSRIGELDANVFDLFLDLLGEALARKPDRHGAVEACSADGTLFIRLEPVDDDATFTITTPHGCFSGEDHHILIRNSDGSHEPAVESDGEPTPVMATPGAGA